ncbi:MAG: hypothetical protein Q8O89_00810, partial [Nanoarchaeota archaeon]|nr:hypothetical protein [Nanoarchaeota archaeon]
MLITNLAIFAIACIVLSRAGLLLVKALSNLSVLLKIREFTLTFIIMSIATSLPDLSIAITSATQGIPELALGAVIGANILDMTLVVGMAIILTGGLDLSKRKEIIKNAFWLLPIAVLPIILFFIGGELSKLDGIILIAVFFIYIYCIFREGRSLQDEAIRKDDIQEVKDERREEKKEKIEEKKERKLFKKRDGVFGKIFNVFEFMKDWLLLGIAIILLVLSANYAVQYARLLSIDLGFPELLIGLIILAFGATLPELVFEITAALKKRQGLLLADPMGSVVVNSTLVLGLVSVIHPIKAPFILFLTSALFMLFVLFMFAVFVATDRKLTVKEGIVLL